MTSKESECTGDFGCPHCAHLPSAPSPAPKCGKPAESMIPRLGVSKACVLEPGHEGDCRGGGNCFKHGEYVGPQCPQWPDCAKPPFTAQQIESMKAASSPAEETAESPENIRLAMDGFKHVFIDGSHSDPDWCRACGEEKTSDIHNPLPEPVSPEVIHVPRIPGTVNTPVGPRIPASEAAAEDEIDALINEVAPPPLVIPETAVHQLRPLLLELIARRKGAEELTYDDCTLADAQAAEQWAVAYVCKVGVSRETMIDAVSTLRAQVLTYTRKGANNG